MATPSRLPPSVLRLHDGLYAIGGSIPIEPPPSWMPRFSKGWLPVQCYAFKAEQDLVIIDTGTTAVWNDIRTGLQAMAAGTSRRTLAMTRRERDCSLNLPALVEEFDISTVLCGGEMSPLDFFAAFDEASTEAVIKAASRKQKVAVRFIKAGDVMKAGPFTFEFVRPPVRVLSGNWIFEHKTRSLLCSDAWGFLTCGMQCHPMTAQPARDDVSVDDITEFFAVKFDWLLGVDTRPVISAIRETMSRYNAERLCPSYGMIVEGASAVTAVTDKTLAAIAELGQRQRASMMTGFDPNLLHDATSRPSPRVVG